jgi:hypothetical protein
MYLWYFKLKSPNLRSSSERTSSIQRNVKLKVHASFFQFFFKSSCMKSASKFQRTFRWNQSDFLLQNKICPSLRQGIDIYVGHSFMKHSWFNQIQCTYIQECNQSCWIILIWRSTCYILLRHNVLLHICNDYSWRN